MRKQRDPIDGYLSSSNSLFFQRNRYDASENAHRRLANREGETFFRTALVV
jgi:hypothetical protein